MFKMTGYNRDLSLAIIKQHEKDSKLSQNKKYATVALCNCTVTNCFREKVIELVMNRWFDYFILFIILLNCVSLSLDSNNPDDKDKLLMKIINIGDYVFLGIFTLEMVLKIIAMGLVMRPYSYLRDPWNIVSFVLGLTLHSSIASSSFLDGFLYSFLNQECQRSE